MIAAEYLPNPWPDFQTVQSGWSAPFETQRTESLANTNLRIYFVSTANVARYRLYIALCPSS